LQKESVQPWILALVSATIDKLQQSREASLIHHARKHGVILAAVEQEQTNYGMQRSCLVFLQQTIDDLGANIILVIPEQIAGEKDPRASDDLVLCFVITVTQAVSQIYPVAQSIVDRFVGIAFA
jgi:hypothetical protein